MKEEPKPHQVRQTNKFSLFTCGQVLSVSRTFCSPYEYSNLILRSARYREKSDAHSHEPTHRPTGSKGANIPVYHTKPFLEVYTPEYIPTAPEQVGWQHTQRHSQWLRLVVNSANSSNLVPSFRRQASYLLEGSLNERRGVGLPGLEPNIHHIQNRGWVSGGVPRYQEGQVQA